MNRDGLRKDENCELCPNLEMLVHIRQVSPGDLISLSSLSFLTSDDPGALAAGHYLESPVSSLILSKLQNVHKSQAFQLCLCNHTTVTNADYTCFRQKGIEAPRE